MSWHNANKSNNELVHLVCDSKAWRHIDTTWPYFAIHSRNIRLGLALNGVNPYANLSTNHFIWRVLLFNYNLPPWLTTKRFFVMLALLIPGKEFVRSENIDVYLEPLLEELEILWKGVRVVDVKTQKGHKHLCLKPFVCGVCRTILPMDYLQATK
jgi:hypothetical protein